MPAGATRHCERCDAEAVHDRVTVFTDGDVTRGKWSRLTKGFECWAWKCRCCGRVTAYYTGRIIHE